MNIKPYNIVFLGLISSLLSGCIQIHTPNYFEEVTDTSVQLSTKTIPLKTSSIEELELTHAFKTELIYSDKNQVEITTDEKLMPYAVAEESGRSLKITLKEKGVFKNPHKISTLSAKIYTTSLPGSYKISGASSLVIAPEFTTALSSFTLKLSGASSFKGKINSTHSELNLSGASSASVELETKELKSNFSGGSSATITLNQSLSGSDFVLSGASSLTLSGSAQKAKIEVTGASGFEGEQFKVQEATVSVSGASKATVYCTESLSANASGASRIDYLGSPKNTNLENSGMSSIKKK